MGDLGLVIIGIIIALLFDFGNGLNDAANAISTVVATKVLSFRAAALLSASFNFVAAFFFTTAVAKTIGTGLIDPSFVTVPIILSGMVGAIAWVYLATFLGLPISASHALIGGFIGAAVLVGGIKVVILSGVIIVLIFIFAAPIIGLIGATLFSLFVLWMFKKKNPHKLNKHFKKLQLVSASLFSLSHGANDAQKTIGIITLLLFSGGFLKTFDVPYWAIIISYLTIGLGTLMGGRKVIKTMGLRLTKLKPVNGFCAETSGMLTVVFCSLLGIPVSTTHVISGSIVGVGLVKRAKSIRWHIARNIMWAWIITIPFSAIAGAATYSFFDLFIL